MSNQKLPYYVTVEVITTDAGNGTGYLLAALVANNEHVLQVEFDKSLESVDAAIESLLLWANEKIDTETHEIELVVWNKDDFARLLHGLKWLSINCMCFVTCFASITNQSMAKARNVLNPFNLPSERSPARAQIMARMFRKMQKVSALFEQVMDTWEDIAEGFKPR